MKNLSVSISKFLLSSVSAVTILLSFFLIFLIFDLWIQEGIPPFENIKFSVAVFFYSYHVACYMPVPKVFH